MPYETEGGLDDLEDSDYDPDEGLISEESKGESEWYEDLGMKARRNGWKVVRARNSLNVHKSSVYTFSRHLYSTLFIIAAVWVRWKRRLNYVLAGLFLFIRAVFLVLNYCPEEGRSSRPTSNKGCQGRGGRAEDGTPRTDAGLPSAVPICSLLQLYEMKKMKKFVLLWENAFLHFAYRKGEKGINDLMRLRCQL